MLPTIDWQGDAIVMVDQRKLPGQEIYVRCRSAQEVAKAIRTMVIRGAPAIGVAAAMGIAAIIHPGGSIKDEESIAAANERGIVMAFTGIRHFKH